LTGSSFNDDPIVLRPWREDDAPRGHAACQDREIRRWLPDLPRPYTHEDARAFVTNAVGLWPYQVRDSRALECRWVDWLRLGKHEIGHIGYWCAPGARGRGTSTRALRRLCRCALDELHLERLDLLTDIENFASQRVAEKVGFQREGVLRSHLRHPDGYRRDSVFFSLLPGKLSSNGAAPGRLSKAVNFSRT
jgi:RimJ/RimL family protein N-acetyltransferase